MSQAAIRNPTEPRLLPKLYPDLLVYQDETAASRNALSFANALAESANGHLSAIMFGFLTTYPTSVYMESIPDAWLAVQKQANKETDAIQKRLATELALVSTKPELHRFDVAGVEAGDLLAEQSCNADAVIIGFDKDGGTDFERRLFESVLLASGRPVIVVPESFKTYGPAKRIVVAWKESPQATRAIHDAMPMLRAADSVRVVIVNENGVDNQVTNIGPKIVAHLIRHGVSAEARVVAAGRALPADIILDETRNFDAGMIVMGGYGHSRLREWIAGGVTRDILAAATVPVLMSH